MLKVQTFTESLKIRQTPICAFCTLYRHCSSIHTCIILQERKII